LTTNRYPAQLTCHESDWSTGLSRDGKYRQRSKTAAQAIADFQASKTLARAREAVELVVAKHNIEQDVSPLNAAAFGGDDELFGFAGRIFLTAERATTPSMAGRAALRL
jgi:hypothetical protein